VLAVTGGRAAGDMPLPGDAAISIDSRALAAGDAYLALIGERFDGHAFAAGALRAGASYAIVSDDAALPAGAPGIVVADTRAALLALAGLARRNFTGLVVAITGSTGKTTTKAFLAALLRASLDGAVAATPQNENNEIGVAKVLLALAGEAVAVVEMGCRHFGDIEPLVAMARPHVGILTNIGDAHLEIMGSRERLAETKWGLFASGARAILNAADEESRRRAASLREPAEYFGLVGDPGVPPGARVTLLAGRESLEVLAGGKRVASEPIAALVPGEHNLRNAAAACAGALAAGADLRRLAAAVAALETPEGRYQRIPLGGLHVIYDAYNASLAGTLATLAAFSAEPAARRIAVLGSMAELGPDAARMHERAGAAAAAQGLAFLLVGGEFADALARGAASAGFPRERIVAFERNDAAARWLLEHTTAGDAVLLKASRKYRLEEIVTALRGASGASV
jgi:UDP-N-acetylmuramoyl-tripeptide--D-alanyl-D-alanine ligase